MALLQRCGSLADALRNVLPSDVGCFRGHVSMAFFFEGMVQVGGVREALVGCMSRYAL